MQWPRSPRVVIAHDYLTQRGGAERVVLDMLRTFPGSRVVTSCWNPAGTFPEFGEHTVETLALNRIPAFRRDPRLAFPFLARAFEEHVVADADVVVCSSSGWAHRITTDAAKVVYCHNPARWLYQPEDYLARWPTGLRQRFIASSGELRRTDRQAARSADRYLVASSIVAERVRGVYGIEPSVVPPARGLSPAGPVTAVPGLVPGYLLTVARARAYKRTRAVCEAMAHLPRERLVVVGGVGDLAGLPANVRVLTGLTDAELRWLYGNAGMLVAMANEDFGLTLPEAQGFGVPTVALRGGGYLDTTVEGVTGVLVDAADVGSIYRGVQQVRERPWSREAIQQAGQRYSPTAFAQRLARVVEDSVLPARRSAVGGQPAVVPAPRHSSHGALALALHMARRP